MTRARDLGATSRRRPRPWPLSRRLVAVAVALAALAAACGSTTVGPSSATAPPSSAGSGTSSIPPAGTPTGTATDGTADSPSPDDTPPPTTSPSPSGAGEGALGCSGSANNRAFFADAAANLPWDVYCGVLPDGWFVETGNYRLGGGGTLRIAYNGPDGARLELREGAVCGGSSDCRPSGEALGPAAFGDREGSLIALEGGGYAIVVDPDAALSWLAITANLDEAASRDIAAALSHVSP